MTLDQWLGLRRGDIVVETRSGVERRVVAVKRYVTAHGHTRVWMSLKKLKKSWTKSPLTHYTIYDDQGRWRLKE